jgi:hypothetical protein
MMLIKTLGTASCLPYEDTAAWPSPGKLEYHADSTLTLPFFVFTSIAPFDIHSEVRTLLSFRRRLSYFRAWDSHILPSRSLPSNSTIATLSMANKDVDLTGLPTAAPAAPKTGSLRFADVGRFCQQTPNHVLTREDRCHCDCARVPRQIPRQTISPSRFFIDARACSKSRG